MVGLIAGILNCDRALLRAEAWRPGTDVSKLRNDNPEEGHTARKDASKRRGHGYVDG